MSSMMSLSIPVEKLRGIPRTKDKNGNEYFNLTIAVNDECDKYGNNVSCMVAQSKEERENKAHKTYLGNGRVFWGHGAISRDQQAPASAPAKASGKDDLPW